MITNKEISPKPNALGGPSVMDAELSKATVSVGNLSYMQKQKYDYLYPFFKESTAQLVTLIEGRGRNGWAKVNAKLTSLDQANSREQHYHDTLYDNFEVGQFYNIAEIPGTVASVRRDLNLQPYASRLRHNCENDLFNLFIVHDVFESVTDSDGNIKKKHIGYVPVFKLKADD